MSSNMQDDGQQYDERPVTEGILRLEEVVDEVRESNNSESVGRLSEEFRELGRQLFRALRAVADSEELRRVGNQVVDSLKTVGDEVQVALDRARQSPEAQDVTSQAKRVAQSLGSTIRSNETTSEVQDGVSNALRNLNAELNKLIDQVQSRTARLSEEVESTAKDVADSAEGKTDELRANFSAGVESAKDKVGEVRDNVAGRVEAAGDDAQGLQTNLAERIEEMKAQADSGQSYGDESNNVAEQSWENAVDTFGEAQDDATYAIDEAGAQLDDFAGDVESDTSGVLGGIQESWNDAGFTASERGDDISTFDSTLYAERGDDLSTEAGDILDNAESTWNDIRDDDTDSTTRTNY